MSKILRVNDLCIQHKLILPTNSTLCVSPAIDSQLIKTPDGNLCYSHQGKWICIDSIAPITIPDIIIDNLTVTNILDVCTITCSDGTLMIDTTLDVCTITCSDGTLNIEGILNVSTITSDDILVINTTLDICTITCSDGTLNIEGILNVSTITSDDTLTIDTTLDICTITCSDGTINIDVTLNVTTITSDSTLVIDTTLDICTITCSDGTINIEGILNVSTITSDSTLVIDTTLDICTITCSDGTINIEGILNVTTITSDDTLTIDTTLDICTITCSSGTINIEGILNVSTITSDDTLTIDTTLDICTITCSSGTINIEGILNVSTITSDDTLTIDTTLDICTITCSSGTINIEGILNVTTITSDSTLVIDTTLDICTITCSDGTINIEGILNVTTITSDSTLVIDTTLDICTITCSDGTINIEGILNVTTITSETGSINIDVTLNVTSVNALDYNLLNLNVGSGTSILGGLDGPGGNIREFKSIDVETGLIITDSATNITISLPIPVGQDILVRSAPNEWGRSFTDGTVVGSTRYALEGLEVGLTSDGVSIAPSYRLQAQTAANGLSAGLGTPWNPSGDFLEAIFRIGSAETITPATFGNDTLSTYTMMSSFGTRGDELFNAFNPDLVAPRGIRPRGALHIACRDGDVPSNNPPSLGFYVTGQCFVRLNLNPNPLLILPQNNLAIDNNNIIFDASLSQRSKKTNITYITRPSSVQFIDQLNVAFFNWKTPGNAPTGAPEIGLITDDIFENLAIPQNMKDRFFTYDKSTRSDLPVPPLPYGYRDRALTAMLVDYAQDLRAQVVSHTNLFDVLQTTINALNNQVTLLQGQVTLLQGQVETLQQQVLDILGGIIP